MKKSLSILKVFAAIMLFAMMTSTGYSAVTHDAAGVTSSLVMGALVAPIALLKSNHSTKENWRKDVPEIFLTLVASKASGPAIRERNPANIGAGVFPSKNTAFGEGADVSTSINGAGGKMQVERYFADFAIGAALEYTLTIGTTFVSNTAIPLLPQYQNDALPTGITFTSAVFSSYQDFVNYYIWNKTLLDRVTINTTDTTFFTTSLKLTQTLADGNTYARARTWNSLSKDQYAQDQTIRDFYGSFLTGTDIRYELASVQAPGTAYTATFTFNIAGSANSYAFNKPRVL